MAKRYIRFFWFKGGGEKNGAKDHPNSTPFQEPWHMPEPCREYAHPPKMAKNQGILILRTHVSPHLQAEAWVQVVIALATCWLRTK